MIELLPALLPIDKIEVTPEVLSVALGAAFTLYFRTRVIAPVFLDAAGDGLMTCEALGSRHFIAKFVTLSAVVQTFKRGMVF